MMAPPAHGQPSLVSSSTTQYPEQTHTMYGRWSPPRTRHQGLGSGCRVLNWLFFSLWQCLQGRCPNSTRTLAPPCTRTRSTRSPLRPLRAKPSRGGLHSTAVLPVTRLPAQSSTSSTSRQRRVSNSLHQQHQCDSELKSKLTFLHPPGAAAAAAQALHLANQPPQQQMYSALAHTPPSMTPGPNPQSPQASFPSAQQTVYIHPQQVQHGYNHNHMAHVQQVGPRLLWSSRSQSGRRYQPPPPHPLTCTTNVPHPFLLSVCWCSH